MNDANHQLLNVEEVIQSNDIELLAQQLRAAHQLLAYKSELANSLTDQLHLRNTVVLQLEEESSALHDQCDTQQKELKELRSICTDLRSLLKRQNRRSSGQPSASNWQRSHHVFDMAVHKMAACQGQDISLGYESHRDPMVLAATTKAPPVKAWSATQTDVLHEEVTFAKN
ncbi:MAG: hypothetical protein HC810_07135 [Acaryochloridaceae cyanobacterium RL_2_7]|nr:hypothetical protein [Acaryochloridaceae cyanobacterium RL_2_7]